MEENNQISVIPGTTGNYILSFEIVPTGTVDDWGNILHFTTGDDCCDFGSRSPGIWFVPDDIIISVSIGDSTDGNWYINTDTALPLNVRTKVILECNGPDVTLSVGESVYTAKQPTRRFSGDLTVYAGDPWWQAANANIYNLSYKILPADNDAGKSETSEIYTICTCKDKASDVIMSIVIDARLSNGKQNVWLFFSSSLMVLPHCTCPNMFRPN